MCFVSVVQLRHIGNSYNNGHFVTEVMDWTTGRWFKCDDNEVQCMNPFPIITNTTSATASTNTRNATASDRDNRKKVRENLHECGDICLLVYVRNDYLGYHAGKQILELQPIVHLQPERQ